MPCIHTKIGILTIVGDYKPGDPRPSGYSDFVEWATVQEKAGLRPARCGQCSLWRYPQEMSGRVVVSHPTDSYGNTVEVRSPVCRECDAREKRSET
jgi:hypothetical protein